MRKKSAMGKLLQRDIPLQGGALAVAFTGIVFSFVTSSPAQFPNVAESMLSAAGSSMSASVLPNPYNTLAQALHDKEDELNKREEAIVSRQQSSVGPSAGEIFGFISFAMSLIVLALLGLNFYMDARRRKKPVLSSKFSVDLRS